MDSELIQEPGPRQPRPRGLACAAKTPVGLGSGPPTRPWSPGLGRPIPPTALPARSLVSARNRLWRCGPGGPAGLLLRPRVEHQAALASPLPEPSPSP